jgi:putative Mg2+ transporter-C (MgtC) family protein
VWFGEETGQGWLQVSELGLAFGLSALIGFEREIRQKSAGLRTHTIVGLGAALFLLVSKYGFGDVLTQGRIVLDPSRVAAQVASGLGFLGAGVIFVRRDAVRGLTTAATIWLTAAVGMAAAAGLPLLAVLCTVAHFVVLYGLTPLAHLLTRGGPTQQRLSCTYLDGRGVLRDVVSRCTGAGWAVTGLETSPVPGAPVVRVALVVQGRGSATALAAMLGELPGVTEVYAGDPEPDA